MNSEYYTSNMTISPGKMFDLMMKRFTTEQTREKVHALCLNVHGSMHRQEFCEVFADLNHSELDNLLNCRQKYRNWNINNMYTKLDSYLLSKTPRLSEAHGYWGGKGGGGGGSLEQYV